MRTTKYKTTLSAIRNRFDQFDSVKVHVGSRAGDSTIGADFLMAEVSCAEKIPNTDCTIHVEEYHYNGIKNNLYIDFEGKIPSWE